MSVVMEKSIPEQVHLKASAAMSVLRKAHLEALVAVHELVKEHLKVWGHLPHLLHTTVILKYE